MLHLIGILGGLIGIAAAIPYIRDIYRKTTKPNRATWLIWSVLLAVSLAAQVAAGASYSALLTAGDLAGTLAVFALAFKYGVGGWTRIDKLSLIAAATGLFLWVIFDQPLLALLMIVLVDYSGGLPTIIKAYKDPESETKVAYAMVATGSALAVISVGSFDFVQMLYPFSLMILMLLIIGAMNLSPNGGRQHA